MRKIYLLISLFTISALLVACGSSSSEDKSPADKPVVEDNEVETNTDNGTANPETDQADQTDSSEDGDEVAKMEELDYVEFELEVEYADNREYEVELEMKKERSVEAKIEDELNGVNMKGPEAFNQLYPLVEQLSITQSTTKDEAIQEILTVFELDANYEEFEVEITFKDGTELEFEDKK